VETRERIDAASRVHFEEKVVAADADVGNTNVPRGGKKSETAGKLIGPAHVGVRRRSCAVSDGVAKCDHRERSRPGRDFHASEPEPRLKCRRHWKHSGA